ncbi:hypothetical protein MBEHAL_1004 [Halarchaeum acidiphilum MH1-52-1]|uniref:Uncharacterized protein n=1 Tax=Halarchaeum acidiphilum MH1-52-1 TaxID=1261545 RepID=U3A3M1_9EURY|nr:hypothetical protein MBEHAL_1004 [Halarchaeum acidiphilum MH1-52-1]
MTSSMTFLVPVTDTLLIRSGLSMHRLLELGEGVLDGLGLVLRGRLAEPFALRFALLDDLLALGFDLLASLGEVFLLQLCRTFFGLLTYLVGPLPGFGEALLPGLLGVGDDVVGVLLGLLNPF